MEFRAPMVGGSASAVGVVQSASLILQGKKIAPEIGDRVVRGKLEYGVAEPLSGFSHYGYRTVDKSEMHMHLTQISE